MAKVSYRCRARCAFITEEDESIDINPNTIKYIIIEDLYYERYMPVIYLSMVVKNELYSMLIGGEKTCKIYLELSRYNVYSGTSMSLRDIHGQFTYILSTANPNYAEEITDTVTADNSYRGITVALISMEINNDIHTSFNGVFSGIDMATLIGKAMEGVKSVVKEPLYNPEFENILIPSLPSKVKLFEFLYELCPFYDTEFMYYHDFNKCYLIDWTGEYCDAHDGENSTVYFDITELSSSKTFQDGMEYGDDYYNIITNPAKTNIKVNKGYDKVSNQLVYIDDDGKIDYVDLDINNNIDSELKQSFNRGANPIVMKNNVESNTIFVNIIKEYIDSSVVTPNKTIVIKNYKDYADYNGNYCLFFKKEILKNVNGEFLSSTNFGLRKVGNITHLGQAVVDAAIKKNGKPGNRIKNPKLSGSGKKNADSKINSNSSTNSNKGTYKASNESNFGFRNTNEEEEITATVKKKVLVPSKTSPTCVFIPMPKRIKVKDDSIIRRDPTKLAKVD